VGHPCAISAAQPCQVVVSAHFGLDTASNFESSRLDVSKCASLASHGAKTLGMQAAAHGKLEFNNLMCCLGCRGKCANQSLIRGPRLYIVGHGSAWDKIDLSCPSESPNSGTTRVLLPLIRRHIIRASTLGEACGQVSKAESHSTTQQMPDPPLWTRNKYHGGQIALIGSIDSLFVDLELHYNVSTVAKREEEEGFKIMQPIKRRLTQRDWVYGSAKRQMRHRNGRVPKFCETSQLSCPSLAAFLSCMR
jgi:hypothetical protein